MSLREKPLTYPFKPRPLETNAFSSSCSSTVSSTRYFFTITSLTTSPFVPVST